MLAAPANIVSPKNTEFILVRSCISSMRLMSTPTTRVIQVTTTAKAYMLNTVAIAGFFLKIAQAIDRAMKGTNNQRAMGTDHIFF